MTRRLWLAVLTALLAVSCGGKAATPAETSQPVTTTAPQPSQSTSTTSVPTTITGPPVSTTTLVAPTTTAVAPTTTMVAETTPEATAVGASLRYTPNRDGFSFENFGGGEAPAELTVNMARRFYGDAQVCSSVVDNECTPYPVILQLISQANRSMRGGLCEGLTVLSLRLANDPVTLASFQNVDDVAALVKADPALLSEIAYWYVTQFATEVQEQASAFLELSPLALARILYEDFAAAEAGEPSVGYTIGIYSSSGGHAVTPYKVTTDGDRWRIYIYDSNWPTSERWIDVDDDGWAYALAATNPTEASEAWGGGVGTMELTPMTSRSGPFTCGFCPTEDEEAGTMLTVAASGDKQMSIQIETEDGDRLGYYDGTFVNEIEGATYRYLISGPSTADPVLVFLPPGVEDFTADVDVIGVPAPAEVETPLAARPSAEAPLEPEPEEDTTQEFSLLILDDERSVQIEAEVPTEPEPEPEPVAPGEPEPEPEPTSLIQFSEEAVAVADIEEATVAIAVDALEVEIEIEQGQQIAVQFAEAPPVEPPPGEPTPDEPVVVEQPSVLSIAIADNAGVELAAVEVDMTAYQVEAPAPSVPTDPAAPEPTTPPVPEAPVVLELSFDEDTGVIDQQEEAVEAWVASDAEYFQAVAEDRVEEVLGESYVEEIEERNDWEAPAEFDDAPDLAETLIVDDDYWEDEQWDEVDYDDDWFEEQAEVEVFVVYEEEEWWDDEPEVWTEEFVDDWDDAEFIDWEAEEEQHILDEFGLDEWNDELLGPSPTETVGWDDDDWEAYDDEMDAIWEEQMADPEAWEEELLDELGVEEWNPEWGPSPTEAAEWTEDDWDDFDEQWAADEEAQILAEEGLEEWPEEWGPSPTETMDWTDADWEAYDAEQEALWAEEEPELDNPPEDEPVDDADWCDDCDDEWQPDDEWTGADEEALILEEMGFDEWPEDWGPSPTESWDWTEEDWQAYDEEQEALWEEEEGVEEEEETSSSEDEQEPGDTEEEPDPEDEHGELADETETDGDSETTPDGDRDDGDEWTGADEEAAILAEEGLDEWPEDWGPSPSETWDWSEDDWQDWEADQVPELDGDPGDDPEFDDWTEDDWDDWSGEDEEGWILEQEGLTEWPEDWGPSPSESWDWSEEDWQAYDDAQVIEPEPEPEPAGWDDPYAACRGTSACESAPGGYATWADYDQANDPTYYDDWGAVPVGFVGWTDYTEAVESGEVSAEEAGEVLPDFVEADDFIPPPPPVYQPTVTVSATVVALQETISTVTTTAQTGTATTVTESGILTHNSNDGHWHLDTTTATTVTTTHVDTTTVVARAGADTVTCTYVDNVESGCHTQRGWDDPATTVTASDPYTTATTTTATVGTEEGCAEGGWRGMGDWCIVSSSSRTDYDYIQFTLDEPTSIRIDAETNLTRAQFNTNNEAADPYIYLNWDTHAPEGDHSGDASAVGVGQQIESDDDGGNDCGNTCVNPPSTAVDVDETPTITYCDNGSACTDGVPVIDNVSDQWDSRIVRTNQAAGDYVLRASVYNTANAGWYRLTIEEVD